MVEEHGPGILMAAFIIVVGILFNPFAAKAEEFHWGFKKSVNGIPPDAGAALNEMLEKHGAIYKGKPDEKVAYLSFDNGYENGYTENILDTLKKENVPATFFLTGHYLKSAAPLVHRMVKDGHGIGNHSFDHPNMANLTEERMEEEWKKFDELLYKTTGVKRTVYARPPEGIFNDTVLRKGNELGYRHIFWSVAFIDWHANKPRGKAYAYKELMNQLHPGAVILMHTVSPDNAEALPDFIRDAKKQGYEFRTLDDLVLEYENVDAILR
ncbi:polysaccharide deacetylase family protein [Sporosarcina thermotolerans]|uniref:Polysaccharide deacetylase family protein n=1 Tax=Sporosarcina thermotolerans TaxID=633404 RepID=A0AAW9ADV1_9BACL|nr:polysaccharide deacetylase family protein [Sporosarcina thermotolerans]MDW0117816.1 polysaccharide deacetylase family protein [Sporosarcina thermotolerans]WHT49370.1 polysaccharide deacetylase family protein [Sporosarcina thermotolerans]